MSTTYVEGVNPGSGAGYAAHGALSQWKLGSGLYEAWTYDGRLRARQVFLGTALWSDSGFGMTWTYGMNGNVVEQRVTGSGLDARQRFRYL